MKQKITNRIMTIAVFVSIAAGVLAWIFCWGLAISILEVLVEASHD